MQAAGCAPYASQGTLLISSPGALVYYHADGPASVLWHIRGRKRVWVYPALEEHFLKRELLEDIFTGSRHEYVPYQNGFDAAAQTFDLDPGQWITWPQNAPHRVTNLDIVNVSLSTEYFTPANRARARVTVANRFFRARWGVSGLAAGAWGAAGSEGGEGRRGKGNRPENGPRGRRGERGAWCDLKRHAFAGKRGFCLPPARVLPISARKKRAA